MSKRKKQSDEQRKKQSERMKARWAEKKAKEAGEENSAPTPPVIDDEPEFEPTSVQETKAAEEAKTALLKEPVVDKEAETTTVLSTDNQNTTVPQTEPVDSNLVASIVAAVIQAQKQFPQAAEATVEQKFDELEATAPNKNHSARLGAGGEVQGIVYRYEVDKNYYPDPTERLLSEPRLARFAMKENFIFRWSVDGVEFKKNNITYAEPRFTLELFRKLFTDDGTPTGQAALVARNIMHEDDFTTRVMAGKLNILDQFDDSEEGFRSLMNEIRFQRFREWLIAVFTPAKIETHRRQSRPMVIDGKVVEVFDTENLIDSSSASDKVSTLSSQNGIGNISTPQTD